MACERFVYCLSKVYIRDVSQVSHASVSLFAPTPLRTSVLAAPPHDGQGYNFTVRFLVYAIRPTVVRNFVRG